MRLYFLLFVACWIALTNQSRHILAIKNKFPYSLWITSNMYNGMIEQFYPRLEKEEERTYIFISNDDEPVNVVLSFHPIHNITVNPKSIFADATLEIFVDGKENRFGFGSKERGTQPKFIDLIPANSLPSCFETAFMQTSFFLTEPSVAYGYLEIRNSTRPKAGNYYIMLAFTNDLIEYWEPNPSNPWRVQESYNSHTDPSPWQQWYIEPLSSGKILIKNRKTEKWLGIENGDFVWPDEPSVEAEFDIWLQPDDTYLIGKNGNQNQYLYLDVPQYKQVLLPKVQVGIDTKKITRFSFLSILEKDLR